MMMRFQYSVKGGDFANAGRASSAVKKILKQLNIEPRRIKRTVVALYEAEVNIVAHAHEGVINVEVTPEAIRLILEDKGPGIPDIEKAMKPGFTTATPKVREMGFGAGMGLPNIEKNTDLLKIDSEVGRGTRLEMEIRLN